MRHFVSLLLLGIIALAGCTATPLPDPPTLDPPSIDGIIHIDETVGTGPPMLGLGAPPGALEPGTTLWIADLETAEAPLFLSVAEDGSVTNVLFTVAVGDVIRAQARRDDLRSEPVDGIVVAVDQPLMEAVVTLGDCLLLSPALELDFGSPMSPASLDVTVQNDCGANVTLTPRLRAGVAPFAVATPLLDVPAGGRGSLTVQFTPSGAGVTLEEDILLLDIGGAAIGRRAISLLGR